MLLSTSYLDDSYLSISNWTIQANVPVPLNCLFCSSQEIHIKALTLVFDMTKCFWIYWHFIDGEYLQKSIVTGECSEGFKIASILAIWDHFQMGYGLIIVKMSFPETVWQMTMMVAAAIFGWNIWSFTQLGGWLHGSCAQNYGHCSQHKAAQWQNTWGEDCVRGFNAINNFSVTSLQNIDISRDKKRKS